jgi:2-polyprenyl-3-methyl-5-hydroxy-6-metoxy-1,4-benzoquinol methylase
MSLFEGLSKWESQIKKTDKVLDVGCWSGSKIQMLDGKCDAYGIDIDEEKLMLAPKKIRSRLFLRDATKNINLKKKFEWVFLEEVLEHVDNDTALLKNIHKSLTSKGKLILTTPRSIPLLEIWDPAWVRWKLGGNRHYHYSKKELFNKLKDAGFKVEEFYIQGNLLWVVVRWINVFANYVLRIKNKISVKNKNGFCDWMLLAERI